MEEQILLETEYSKGNLHAAQLFVYYHVNSILGIMVGFRSVKSPCLVIYVPDNQIVYIRAVGIQGSRRNTCVHSSISDFHSRYMYHEKTE